MKNKDKPWKSQLRSTKYKRTSGKTRKAMVTGKTYAIGRTKKFTLSPEEMLERYGKESA